MTAKTRNIITTDKDAFLKAEYQFFKATYENDFDWFVSDNEKDIDCCPVCKVLYWKGTKKRCECDKNKEVE